MNQTTTITYSKSNIAEQKTCCECEMLQREEGAKEDVIAVLTTNSYSVYVTDCVQESRPAEDLL